MPIAFDNTFARLPERFFERRAPTPVAAPTLIRINRPLAEELGIDPEWLEGPDGIAMLAGNRLPDSAEPLAQAYAGHQFGGLVPQLGDGRAVLLGEVLDRHGVRRDLQLKGAGKTAFSRGGDGRAALGPVLREYLVSEGMAALGIPTTRALAAVKTGELVFRERPLPGAVLTRVAASHLRVGTFEYFAIRRDDAALRRLTDYAIDRHYPQAKDAERPALALLAYVAEAQAALVAQWMLVGFIHGVMNTDNTALSGETIDYGPCAFMDAFHPSTVFSSIDHMGRYAYGNQPKIAQWNLARFAETLLPLIDEDPQNAAALATQVVEAFAGRFELAIETGWCHKIGLPEATQEDVALALDLLKIMTEQRADFTLTFRALGDELRVESAEGEAAAGSGTGAGAPVEPAGAEAPVGPAGAEAPAATKAEAAEGHGSEMGLEARARAGAQAAAGIDAGAAAGARPAARDLFDDPAAFDEWAARWRARLTAVGADLAERRVAMHAVNPRFIPRNHRVEQAIRAAEDHDDFGPFERLLEVLEEPYEEQPGREEYALPPQPEEQVTRTFCGT